MFRSTTMFSLHLWLPKVLQILKVPNTYSQLSISRTLRVPEKSTRYRVRNNECESFVRDTDYSRYRELAVCDRRLSQVARICTNGTFMFTLISFFSRWKSSFCEKIKPQCNKKIILKYLQITSTYDVNI